MQWLCTAQVRALQPRASGGGGAGPGRRGLRVPDEDGPRPGAARGGG